MDNSGTMDVANGAGRLTIARADLESYLARGYKVPGGQVAPKKATQPSKKKSFSKKSEDED